MPLLGCVVYETLRLYPAAPYYSRTAAADVLLQPHHAPTMTRAAAAVVAAHETDGASPRPPYESKAVLIKKGAGVFVPFSVIHRDPRYWGADAAAFRPERFERGISEACNHPLCVTRRGVHIVRWLR